jgi:hypothetical protein
LDLKCAATADFCVRQQPHFTAKLYIDAANLAMVVDSSIGTHVQAAGHVDSVPVLDTYALFQMNVPASQEHATTDGHAIGKLEFAHCNTHPWDGAKVSVCEAPNPDAISQPQSVAFDVYVRANLNILPDLNIGTFYCGVGG